MSTGSAAESIAIRMMITSLFGAGAYLCSSISYQWKKRKAITWAPVEATVRIVEHETLPKNAGYQVRLGYSYFAEEYRSGEYITVFADEDSAYTFGKYAKDCKFTALYNPQRPDQSFIDDHVIGAAVEQMIEREAEDDLAHPAALQFNRADYPNAG